MYENCSNDENRNIFNLPSFIEKMIKNKWLGDKTKQGFYKKTRDKNGKRKILSLDLSSFSYSEKKKVKFEVIGKAKKIKNLKDRFNVLISGNDKASNFYKKMFGMMFSYVSNRVPEISNDIYKIDDAMKAGFGWEMGPFEIWDSIGINKGIDLIKRENLTIPKWLEKTTNLDSFYSIEDGNKQFYEITKNRKSDVPVLNKFILLNNLRSKNVLWKNDGVSVFDIGDGVLNIEFHTKMNSIGEDVINGVQKGIEIAEKNYRGIVIGNQGAHFSAGADISMIFTLAVEQEYKKLDLAIKTFQDTSMLIRYSSIPIVVAPHGFTFGGGCDIELPRLKEYFLNIGQAKVSTSGQEAFELGYLRKGIDSISINTEKQIQDAKEKVILLDNSGYTKPIRRKDIKVLGNQALGMFIVGADSFKEGNYITEHEKLMSEKLAHVLCGGNLSSPTIVSEQYLLDLEREAFLSLCGEEKTLERIKYMLEKGKPLRN